MTRLFPKDEQFGLTGQLRRATVSVAANIAEGRGRYHKKEFVQFLYVARGSLYETITLLKTAGSLEHLSPRDLETLLVHCQSIAGKISGLINFLKSLPRSPIPPGPTRPGAGEPRAPNALLRARPVPGGD